MNTQQLLQGIDSAYILAALVAIGVMLAYIATKLQEQSKKSHK